MRRLSSQVCGLLAAAALSAWGPAGASPLGACTGTGTITGMGGFSATGQVWVTDSADSFNQQTSAMDAFAASRGCVRVDQSGRQSSSVFVILGSCADPSRDGQYQWQDSANPCDMSLPLSGSGGGGPAGFDPTNTAHLLQALFVGVCLGSFLHGLGFGARGGGL